MSEEYQQQISQAPSAQFCQDTFRRYTIHELYKLRPQAQFITFPLGYFSPEAFQYGIVRTHLPPSPAFSLLGGLPRRTRIDFEYHRKVNRILAKFHSEEDMSSTSEYAPLDFKNDPPRLSKPALTTAAVNPETMQPVDITTAEAWWAQLSAEQKIGIAETYILEGHDLPAPFVQKIAPKVVAGPTVGGESHFSKSQIDPGAASFIMGELRENLLSIASKQDKGVSSSVSARKDEWGTVKNNAKNDDWDTETKDDWDTEKKDECGTVKNDEWSTAKNDEWGTGEKDECGTVKNDEWSTAKNDEWGTAKNDECGTVKNDEWNTAKNDEWDTEKNDEWSTVKSDEWETSKNDERVIAKNNDLGAAKRDEVAPQEDDWFTDSARTKVDNWDFSPISDTQASSNVRKNDDWGISPAPVRERDWNASSTPTNRSTSSISSKQIDWNTTTTQRQQNNRNTYVPPQPRIRTYAPGSSSGPSADKWLPHNRKAWVGLKSSAEQQEEFIKIMTGEVLPRMVQSIPKNPALDTSSVSEKPGPAPKDNADNLVLFPDESDRELPNSDW